MGDSGGIEGFEAVIGLEVHAQLATDSKLFCGCATSFGAAANDHICPVCIGLPGALPVLNKRAVELAVRAARALGCEVANSSTWDRKNYFYPDLPKGYQISQFAIPYASGGKIPFFSPCENAPAELATLPLTRIHIEEDAGKSVHDDQAAHGRSVVDYNRGGTPLIEIVSEPELHRAADAAACVRSLRQLLRYLGVCDGNMQEGSLRCDANVSIRPVGESRLGTRAEIKNLNSFRFIEAAVDYEIQRQVELVRGGGKVAMETRLWDTDAGVTRSMRSKEEAHDYRYFPDPDLPPLIIDEKSLPAAWDPLGELPMQKVERYQSDCGLAQGAARHLAEDAATAQFFEDAVARHNNPQAVSNWVLNALLSESKGGSLADLEFGGAALGELIELIDDGTISGKIAKDVLVEMTDTGDSPADIVDRHGWRQLSDSSAIEAMVAEVIANNPGQRQQYLAGKTKLLGFFVGQVMKQSQGQADPKIVNELLRKLL